MRSIWLRPILCVSLAAFQLGAQQLPGTQPLTRQGDLAMEMVAGIDRFLMRRLAAAPDARAKAKPSRASLKKIIGATETRLPFDTAGLISTLRTPALVATSASFRVVAVRWPVLPGVDGEGLLLTPRRAAVARVIAIPDADTTPEMLTGLAPGIPEEAQFARRLAENGVEVLVMSVIDRADTFSGNPAVRMTNMPHREWLYRQLYPVGRTLLGVEVQKVLAAVDWSASLLPRLPIGVAGYGEGGALALLAAALDERIASTLVSGYFEPRETVWRQPIYRDIWGQLNEFGDAEVANLVAPRTLVVEASKFPAVAGPPPERTEAGKLRRGAAPGILQTPSLADVEREARRAPKLKLVASANGEGNPGSNDALQAFLAGLEVRTTLNSSMVLPRDERGDFDSSSRMRAQVAQVTEYAQRLVRESDAVRREYWKAVDFHVPASLEKAAPALRKGLWEEVIGKLPVPNQPLNAETRVIYDKPAFTGYEVVLPIWPEVYAYGVLLLPKDLKPGERRPVVVAQHGLNGRPQDLVEAKEAKNQTAYQSFAARLAERGFIVYAPQNPYIGDETFRVLLRKAHPLKLSLFSFIIGQHQRTLDWLAVQPFVDPQRIGFYGLSYGGKTAMRVPSLLSRYALSICSGDFNEWIWKVTSVGEPFSYMFTHEYDMLEWNLANTFNYSEMAALIAPRPFMVERAHRDPVGIDEWVAYEYAKVRRMYGFLGIADRTEIEFFDGVHQVRNVGTFDFLHKHLNWPKR